MRKLCFEWKGLVYGCLQNTEKGAIVKQWKKEVGRGGSFVARTRMQDIASLTDAGVIVIVNNTQLDAAVQALFPKGRRRAHKRAITAGATSAGHDRSPPRLNVNEEAMQCGCCRCHNRAAPSSLTSNGQAHLPPPPPPQPPPASFLTSQMKTNGV